MKPFTFHTYQNSKGEHPVLTYFDSLDSKIWPTLFDKIDHYESLGFDEIYRSKFIEKITSTSPPLLELKFKLKTPIRVIGFREGDYFIALHAFTKDYEGSIKRREIESAVSRLREYESRRISKIIKHEFSAIQR
jgi:hypothetical protein